MERERNLVFTINYIQCRLLSREIKYISFKNWMQYKTGCITSRILRLVNVTSRTRADNNLFLHMRKAESKFLNVQLGNQLQCNMTELSWVTLLPNVGRQQILWDCLYRRDSWSVAQQWNILLNWKKNAKIKQTLWHGNPLFWHYLLSGIIYKGSLVYNDSACPQEG